MNCDETKRLLDAYADGELDLTASLGVEEHLANCPECRRQLEESQSLATLVRETAPRFEAPAFLATRIRASLRAEAPPDEKMPWWRSLHRAWIFSGLGGALAAIAITAAFWSWTAQPSGLLQEAIADHVRSLQVSHLMDVASTDRHTVKPWFAGKLDYSPQVIDLGPDGFPLIGGRLDVLDGRDVAAIVYQGRKHFINLFVWPSTGSPLNASFHRQNGYHVLAWRKSDMNYLSVSELDEKELRNFATLIQKKTD